MLRGVWVPCWRDIAGLAAPPFEARGADSVSWVTGVVSWLLRGVCETARHHGTQPEHIHTHTHSQAVRHSLRKDKAEYIFPTIPGTYPGRPCLLPAHRLPLGGHSHHSLVQTQETSRGPGHQIVSDHKMSLHVLLILAALEQPLEAGVKVSEQGLGSLQGAGQGPLRPGTCRGVNIF
ncbi:hypothetical protein F7725_009566 [Dissostichus mawsoni]|uniref:Uncharacterized protein n=1 Tax=Dissostichus mawsoni TaxID=36200 RepID=A0A7J5XNZ4_DISMA|nr:hypothetical protein F7725_009566 [Dissostichus mawsoni]